MTGGEAVLGPVLLDITVSLDGYVAGPGDEVGRLHRWVFAGGVESAGFSAELSEVLADADIGAVIAGRRTFDLASGWGGDPSIKAPWVILSHSVPEKVANGDWSSFTFVSGGVEEAVAAARDLAGGRTVYVMGGADIARQCLDAGLLDELRLHVVPVLLGAGIRLFERLEDRTELELVSAVEASETLRVRYRVVR
jgi:dihydrofolate reductase